MALTEQQIAFIDENPFIGVVTDLRPDGSLHSTVVWVDVAGGKVGFNTAVGRAKERYLRNDPRIALIVVDPGNSYKWVSISGRVQFTEDGADAQIDKLAKKYLNQDTYPFRNDTEVRVSVWIDADKVDSSGFE
ncbi:MAG: PPOX class F420-dependent oxidoreductase [Gaiellaceae bacterium]